jgi:hypothetical protein
VSELECRRAGELLPNLGRGALDAEATAWLNAHLADCVACRGELALVRRLGAAAAEPPEELAGRIRAALQGDALSGAGAAPGWSARRGRFWGIATAAALILGVFGTLTMQRLRAPSDDELWQAYAEEAPPAWVLDDGLVAGAPVLEDLSGLSDEDLAGVLQELGP